MLPRLSSTPAISQQAQDYLTALAQQQFEGDIVTSFAARLSMATDNSVYQQLPQAILFPKTVADVVRLTKLAQQAHFQSLTFTPRGGGTGTNGQALNNNIIVDLSRHMTAILELNVQERWVRVQAGVVKDQLNAFLKPHGLFFAPELSTSNRATIGGMINTDASGQGSLQYGKTSDHVLGLKSVLINGEILTTEVRSSTEMAEPTALSPFAAQLERNVSQLCRDHRNAIINDLPQLNRFLTGYDLKNVFNDDMSAFNLSRIITGSEGSLAFVCEAKLNLLPIPKYRTLLNIKYDAFDSALRAAPMLVKANALSVETVDAKVLNLAKQDIIWHSVKDLLTESPEQPIVGINIVEFAGNNQQLIEKRVSALCAQLDEAMAAKRGGLIGYQRCDDLDSILKIYAMRKKAVGLLGNAKGRAKPIPFVEDTCVPPEHLADYITEFRALLDSHQLQYGMFGHVDAGVLHVRPALDLCDEAQVRLLKTLSDRVVELTAKYGGLIWGEHGKGLRSSYAPRFFGDTLWQLLRQIKTWFDPHNRLNPGKICTPLEDDTALLPVLSPMRADFDRQIPLQTRDAFSGAMNCNGNGLCFNYDVHSPMCPSYKVSRDRTFSPKGRAAMVREWLRLLSEQGVTPQDLDFNTKSAVSLRDLAQKLRSSYHKWRGEYDFSHEVKATMDTCLACKACASQCPIKIDVPRFRAKFNHFYHQRYLRPIKDHVVANVELYAPLMAKAPKLANALTNNKLTATLAQKTLGMVDLPTLSTPTLAEQLQKCGCPGFSLDSLEQLSPGQKAKSVLVVQDPFTSFYDATVVADFVRLVQKLGFTAYVLPFKPNGKAQHIKGFLTRFAKTARNQGEFLYRMSQLGIPMVGVDPAIVLSYRDEYREILGDSLPFDVLMTNEWLIRELECLPTPAQMPAQTWYLYPHCTEVTAVANSNQLWRQIFSHFGQQLECESVGCCGMAGTFGHESQHIAMSKAIFHLSWAEKLKVRPAERCLATGYSCRSQVKRMAHFTAKHPVQALLSLWEG